MGNQGRKPPWALDAVEVRKIPQELKKAKMESMMNGTYEPDPLEEVFVDDPRALKEQEPSFRRSNNR